MTDEEIVSGFDSLHAALTTGFDHSAERLAHVETGLRGDIAGLESRMFRRFDAVDERFEGIDSRPRLGWTSAAIESTIARTRPTRGAIRSPIG